MLDVDRLVVLRAVIAQGSIAAAGRELGYTRSAISQQMSALERSVGEALFIRGRNGVTATATGRRLIGHTERILVEIRAAEASLARTRGELTGTIRIGVPFREGPALMIGALTAVRRRHPGLIIRLSAIKGQRARDEVLQGRLDIVMVSTFGVVHDAAATGLREWVLGRDALMLCIPEDHALRGRSSCPLADLAEEDWVISPASPLGQLTAGLCAAAGFQPRVVAEVDDVGTALGLVANQWGITIAPQLTPLLPGQRVQRVPLEGVEAHRHSSVVVRDGEQDSLEIAAVVSAVTRVSKRVGYL